jgi:hypothetical protein
MYTVTYRSAYYRVQPYYTSYIIFDLVIDLVSVFPLIPVLTNRSTSKVYTFKTLIAFL